MGALSVAKADWFQKPETRAVFACLNREGFEARAVGGAVRNAILGWGSVVEVDFATSAKPEDVMRLGVEAGVKALPTGISHGTVTFIIGGIPFEITTLREDVATDGRHATVAFGTDWAADARRRDFTMNALYADAKGEVHDPLGGLSDLRAGRVRFIGDPSERIREDYLRILRFFRFSASYAEGDFDRDGVQASIRERMGLLRLSRERIRAELLRILAARRARDSIRIMDESGLLLLVLGGPVRRMRFERLCEIESALQIAPDPILRLAALAIFVDEDAQRLAQWLRLSSEEARDLADLPALSQRISTDIGAAEQKTLLYRLGPRPYLGGLLLAWASAAPPPDDARLRAAASLAGSWQRPVFPIGGADLIAIGQKPGPSLGALLRSLEDRWAAGGFAASRTELLDEARQALDSGDRPGKNP